MSSCFLATKTAEAKWQPNIATNLISASAPERTHALATFALVLNADTGVF